MKEPRACKWCRTRLWNVDRVRGLGGGRRASGGAIESSNGQGLTGAGFETAEDEAIRRAEVEVGLDAEINFEEKARSLLPIIKKERAERRALEMRAEMVGLSGGGLASKGKAVGRVKFKAGEKATPAGIRAQLGSYGVALGAELKVAKGPVEIAVKPEVEWIAVAELGKLTGLTEAEIEYSAKAFQVKSRLQTIAGIGRAVKRVWAEERLKRLEAKRLAKLAAEGHNEGSGEAKV